VKYSILIVLLINSPSWIFAQLEIEPIFFVYPETTIPQYQFGIGYNPKVKILDNFEISVSFEFTITQNTSSKSFVTDTIENILRPPIDLEITSVFRREYFDQILDEGIPSKTTSINIPIKFGFSHSLNQNYSLSVICGLGLNYIISKKHEFNLKNSNLSFKNELLDSFHNEISLNYFLGIALNKRLYKNLYVTFEIKALKPNTEIGQENLIPSANFLLTHLIFN